MDDILCYIPARGGSTGVPRKNVAALGEQWCVHPTDELLHRLRELAGDAQVRVVY